MQKKIILDTFTLQEIKKYMHICICGWKSTDITEIQKKKKKKRRNRKTSINQITYIHIHKIFFNIIMEQFTRQQHYNNNNNNNNDHACARMIII